MVIVMIARILLWEIPSVIIIILVILRCHLLFWRTQCSMLTGFDIIWLCEAQQMNFCFFAQFERAFNHVLLRIIALQRGSVWLRTFFKSSSCFDHFQLRCSWICFDFYECSALCRVLWSTLHIFSWSISKH